MNKTKKIRLRLIILVIVTSILVPIFISISALAYNVGGGGSSGTRPIDFLSDEEKIIATQYLITLKRYFDKSNIEFKDYITTNDGVETLHDAISKIRGNDNLSIGYNLDSNNGKTKTEDFFKGHSHLYSQGFTRFFKLDSKSKDELLSGVLGYTKEQSPEPNLVFNIDTKASLGNNVGTFKNVVKIDGNGKVINGDDDIFARHIKGKKFKKKQNQTHTDYAAEVESTLKDELMKYINDNKPQRECPIFESDINVDYYFCSQYSKDLHGCAKCGSMKVFDYDILISKPQDQQTYIYRKGTIQPDAALLNYLSRNFFPSSFSQNKALNYIKNNNVLDYKFWFNYLLEHAKPRAKDDENCKATWTPISPNSTEKIGKYNEYETRITLVNKEGKLQDYKVIWSKYDASDGKHKPKNKDKKIKIGFHHYLSPNSYYGASVSPEGVSCKDIAKNLSDASGKLTDEDKKKIAEDSKYIFGATTEDGSQSQPEDSSSTPAEKTCYTNAGRSLGWILCPLLDFFKDTAQNIYQHIANNYLEISPQMFTGGGQALFAAWQIFQGIANIGFVIFLLVIIFSQLTGKGIDNYGVKRALPRLIIAAILINLSYFLCQIAVDLSNIVGKGVYDLFTSFEFNATKGVNSLATDLGTTLQSIQTGQTATSLTMFGILAGLLAGGIAVVSVGPLAALVALLISLFTAVVAILIVFVLLGLRQALAIILVATSPVAFVCYIFPGTQKLFTKWTKILSGILLTFPICGIMMGGGEFASKLLLSTEQTGFFFGLVAMLAAIAPLFFVPVVLRNSLAAVGNIGAKVSTFASGLGKKAQSGIRNNENYKNWRTRQAAGLKYDKDGKLVESRSGKFRNRIAGSSFGRAFGVQRNMSRGRAGALKELSDRTTAESLMSSDRLEAANAAQIEKATQATMDDKMALINAQTNNGAIIVGDSNAFNEYEAAKASGDTSGMRTALAKLGTENSVFGQYKRAQAKGDQDGMRSALEVAGQSKTTAKEFKRALAMDMATNADSYTAADYSAIAKQMVNGKGSQNWKMSGAEAFEWATQVNSGRINPADNSSEQLSNWATSGNNLKNVVENQIASSEQIAGLSSSNLEEINRNINAAAGAGDVKALEAQSMLKANATQTLSDYTNGTRDIGVDKLDNIAKAAGYSDFTDYENQQARATLYLQQEEDFKRAIGSLDPTKLRARHSRETDANKRKIISDMYKNKTGKPI